jgi:3-oxoacyl-[acyl-carrier protein] reductase
LPSLEDAVAVITGAGHGIGRATARLFADEGASLVLGDINEETLAEAEEECRSRGAKVLAHPYDQRDRASVDALFQNATDHYGRVDTVANIAGIYPFGTVLDTTDDLWADVITTNLTGVFYCCRAAFGIMTSQQAGCVVNVASGAAEIPYAGLAAYAASKGGIESLTRVLAKEGAPKIRVNAVAPGPTLSWPHDEDDQNDTGDDALMSAAKITDSIPLGRWIQPAEIADAILYLSSPRASAIYGQIMRVNGGNHMV